MEVEGADGDCIQEFCLCCDTAGSGKTLICNGHGCPIAIHEECLNYEPDFDDMGKFYCPYCWFKRELERTRGLKRKALAAKEKLTKFRCLRKDGDGGNEKKLENEAENTKATSESSMPGKMNSGDCESDDCKGVAPGVDSSNEKLTKLRCLRKDRDGGNEKKLEKEAENTKATSESSMPGKMNSGDCESDDCKGVAPGVDSSTQGISDEKDISKAEKHRRLWTAEEEEMMMEGVQKFSATTKKNIPWRKILEFGRHVFHPTRTPADLKDKWKNLRARGFQR